MAGKIKQMWEALEACFRANNGPLTGGQIVAWIDLHYKDSDFNPNTLKAQLYRSCINNVSAHEYNTPKILSYEKSSRTYFRVSSETVTSKTGNESHSAFVSAGIEGERDRLDDVDEDQSDLLVGVEAQLRDYLAKNLNKIEKGLQFWSDSPPSVEFAVENRRIDILARDSNGIPVVVELKRWKAYDRVVGQALLYQALVSAKFKSSKVRVILVANEISDELRMACSRQQDFKLYEYELTMQLNPIDSMTVEEEV